MPAPPPVYEGTVLAGKYRVERVIGSGGMGVVVAAQHLALGERVAIKFLLPQAVTNAEVIARFLREGRAAARVRSEHVARVFDVGTLDDGAPYLVMEYLEGSDLGAILRARGPLPVPITVDYALQACEALADAHALGVVHRDLKPSNLFLTHKSDGSPSIKLIDFGISKLVDQREGDVGVTASAIMMGSPLFMAPEQMKSARDVDARADVWSMGGIIYTLLTGHAPFLGETVMAIYDLILQGPPRAGAENAEVPPELDQVIAGCLQKDPSLRITDVAQIAAAIAPFGPPGSNERAARVHRILSSGRSSLATGNLTPPAAPSLASAPPPANTPRPSTPVPARSGASVSNVAREVASDGPWNSTHGPTKRRSKGVFVALGLTALIGGAAAVGWFSLSHRASALATANVEASSPPSATPAPSSQPSVEVTATATAEASAAPSSEPEATASGRKAAPHPVGRPKLLPRPAEKPNRDLFQDPR